jgi:hypothetical protein
MGLSFTFFAASIWPCIPFLVGSHQVATAFGIVTVCLNIALFGLPLVVARIMDNNDIAPIKAYERNPNGYNGVEYFFILLCILGIFFSCVLFYVDQRNGGKLNKSAKEIKTEEEVRLLDDTDDIDTPRSRVHTYHTESESEYIHNYEHDHESDNLIVKVVGEGRGVPVPHTYVHHHEHVHREDMSPRERHEWDKKVKHKKIIVNSPSRISDYGSL